MKTNLVSLMLSLGLVAIAFAGKPHKGGGKPQPQPQSNPAQQQPATPQTAGQPPSTRLGQFLSARLDQILAPLDQPITLPRTDLMQLRDSLVDQYSKAAQPEKAPFQLAVSVCDAVSTAMDEREKTTAAFQTARNAPGIQEVHDTTVRLPRHGRGSGKAAHAAVHQERYENQEHQAEAARKGEFLSSNYPKQWGDRSIVLRQNIQQLVSREREAERAVEQAKTATPQAVPSATP